MQILKLVKHKVPTVQLKKQQHGNSLLRANHENKKFTQMTKHFLFYKRATHTFKSISMDS